MALAGELAKIRAYRELFPLAEGSLRIEADWPVFIAANTSLMDITAKNRARCRALSTINYYDAYPVLKSNEMSAAVMTFLRQSPDPYFSTIRPRALDRPREPTLCLGARHGELQDVGLAGEVTLDALMVCVNLVASSATTTACRIARHPLVDCPDENSLDTNMSNPKSVQRWAEAMRELDLRVPLLGNFHKPGHSGMVKPSREQASFHTF